MRTKYSELKHKSLITTVAHTNTRVSNIFKRKCNLKTTRTKFEADAELFMNSEHYKYMHLLRQTTTKNINHIALHVKTPMTCQSLIPKSGLRQK